MRAEFRAEGISVSTELPEALPPVWAKEGHLQQVFVNLFMNARDALKGSPVKHIVIKASTLDDHIAVSVRDTGPGIAPDLQGRIFDPFFTTKPPGQGTGLGLSVSRNIVNDLGGTLTCESQPGEGATFAVALPRSGDASKQRGAKELHG